MTSGVSTKKRRPLGLVREVGEDEATWRRRCNAAVARRRRAEMNPEQKAEVATYNAHFRRENRACIMAREVVYRTENAERRRTQGLARARANREQYTERYRAWLKANPGKAREFAKRWRNDNKSWFVAYNAERRAERIQRTVPWADKKAIANIYREARRISEETGTSHHVDHVIPLRGKTVSGLHVEGNLQIIPATQNLRKRNKFSGETVA